MGKAHNEGNRGEDPDGQRRERSPRMEQDQKKISMEEIVERNNMVEAWPRTDTQDRRDSLVRQESEPEMEWSPKT